MIIFQLFVFKKILVLKNIKYKLTFSFILFAFQGNDLLLTNNFNQEADIREIICSVYVTNCWSAGNYFHSLKTQSILTTSNLIPIWHGVNVNCQRLKMLLFSNDLLKGQRKQYSFSNKTRFNKYSLSDQSNSFLRSRVICTVITF